VRQGTRDCYETSFKHILPELGSIPLNEIIRERMKDFVAHLVGKHYEKRVKVKTYPDPKKKRNPQIEWKTVRAPMSKASIRIEEIQPLSTDEVRLFLEIHSIEHGFS